jgi:hypothetical protein
VHVLPVVAAMVLEFLPQNCSGEGWDILGLFFSLMKFGDFTSDVFFILELYDKRNDDRLFMRLYKCAIVFTVVGVIIDIFKALYAHDHAREKFHHRRMPEAVHFFCVFPTGKICCCFCGGFTSDYY